MNDQTQIDKGQLTHGIETLTKRMSWIDHFQLDLKHTWHAPTSSSKYISFFETIGKICVIVGKVLLSPMRTTYLQSRQNAPYKKVDAWAGRLSKVVKYLHKTMIEPEEAMVSSLLQFDDAEVSKKTLELQKLVTNTFDIMTHIFGQLPLSRQTSDTFLGLYVAFFFKLAPNLVDQVRFKGVSERDWAAKLIQLMWRNNHAEIVGKKIASTVRPLSPTRGELLTQSEQNLDCAIEHLNWCTSAIVRAANHVFQIMGYPQNKEVRDHFLHIEIQRIDAFYAWTLRRTIEKEVAAAAKRINAARHFKDLKTRFWGAHQKYLANLISGDQSEYQLVEAMKVLSCDQEEKASTDTPSQAMKLACAQLMVYGKPLGEGEDPSQVDPRGRDEILDHIKHAARSMDRLYHLFRHFVENNEKLAQREMDYLAKLQEQKEVIQITGQKGGGMQGEESHIITATRAGSLPTAVLSNMCVSPAIPSSAIGRDLLRTVIGHGFEESPGSPSLTEAVLNVLDTKKPGQESMTYLDEVFADIGLEYLGCNAYVCTSPCRMGQGGVVKEFTSSARRSPLTELREKLGNSRSSPKRAEAVK